MIGFRSHLVGQGQTNMFAFLFGKKTAAAAKERKFAGAEAVADLARREEELEKKIQQLERLKATFHENAISHKARGASATAIHFLRREKQTDEQLAAANNMLLTVIQQRSAVEQAAMNRDSMTVLAGAAATAKAYQTEWSADRVADLMDELDDIKATGREVNDLIRLAAGRDAPTDEELLAELDASCAERVELRSTAVNDSCQLTAPAPASQTPAGQTPASEDAILAAMLAAPTRPLDTTAPASPPVPILS
jgi:hypothetical protein